MTRPTTPPHVVTRDDGTKATRIRVQRCCNGCGASLGDATEQELEAAMLGQPLPDVRGECLECSSPAGPLTVAEAIVALVPGAEGVIKP